MRVNTSLLAAAIALFSTQCLVTAKNSGLYSTDSGSSDATEDSTDVYQDDGTADDIILSNKEVLNKALGSAANGDDYTKYQALNNMSEEELEKIMHAMTPLKKKVIPASSPSPSPYGSITWDSDANSAANAWATKEGAIDSVQDDTDSATGLTNAGKGAVESGTGWYSGKKTADPLSLYDTSGSDDSDSLADKPLSSKNYLYSEDWDLDGSSDDDLLDGNSGSKFGYTQFHGVRDDSLNAVPQKSDSAFSTSKLAPPSSYFYASDDGSFDDVPLWTKHSSYAKDAFMDSSDEDDWYTGLASKDTSLLAPKASSDTFDTTTSFDDDDKEWDALFKELSSDASDASSSGMDLSDSSTDDAALTAQMKANKEKLKAALGPKVVAGGDYSVLNALTKMDQEQLDNLLESFSTDGSLDSDSVNSGVPTKGQKKVYMTPTSSVDSDSGASDAKVDMDGLLALSDKDLKPPSLADYLKNAGSSDSSSCSGSAPSALAPTSSSSSEDKPCHVSWWRKLAFWKSEHKCSEARRLRTEA